MVPELPASFYCGITSKRGMEINTEWYIDGVPYSDANTIEATTSPRTNLTISRLRLIRSPIPLVEVSCRTSLFPDIVYDHFQVGKQSKADS